MQIKYTPYSEELIIVEKPVNISTHTAGDGIPGLVEVLSEQINKELYVCHRLDKLTSGVMIFALTPLAAKEIGALFEQHKISKIYHCVTDKTPALPASVTVRSHIRKYRGRFVSWPQHEDLNAQTVFTFAGAHPLGQLWHAQPLTGKSHQIRLHARQIGITILGDSDHAGKKHERLMLHAAEISFEWKGKREVFKSSCLL